MILAGSDHFLAGKSTMSGRGLLSLLATISGTRTRGRGCSEEHPRSSVSEERYLAETGLQISELKEKKKKRIEKIPSLSHPPSPLSPIFIRALKNRRRSGISINSRERDPSALIFDDARKIERGFGEFRTNRESSRIRIAQADLSNFGRNNTFESNN